MSSVVFVDLKFIMPMSGLGHQDFLIEVEGVERRED